MEAERKRGLSGSEEGEAAKVPRLEARGSDSSSSGDPHFFVTRTNPSPRLRLRL